MSTPARIWKVIVSIHAGKPIAEIHLKVPRSKMDISLVVPVRSVAAAHVIGDMIAEMVPDD